MHIFISLSFLFISLYISTFFHLIHLFYLSLSLSSLFHFFSFSFYTFSFLLFLSLLSILCIRNGPLPLHRRRRRRCTTPILRKLITRRFMARTKIGSNAPDRLEFMNESPKEKRLDKAFNRRLHST